MSPVPELPSFLKLNNTPVYVYTTFYLSIHSSMDNLVASTFWLLGIMLLIIFILKDKALSKVKACLYDGKKCQDQKLWGESHI